MLNRLTKLMMTAFFLAVISASVYSQTAEDIILFDEDFVFETEDIVIEDALLIKDPVIQPGQMTVFDRSSIEATGARTVADVIQRAPGVIVSRQGGILEPQTVSIRGGASDHVLILIDGKPAESLWSGSSDLSRIPIENVERIEVIRGAGTAVYGEGAFSGVINIITVKDSEAEASAEFDYGYGSFDTHMMNLELSGPVSEDAAVSTRITAGGLYTGGGYTYTAGTDEQQRVNNDGWSANLSAGGSWEAEAAGLSVSSDFKASERGAPGIMEFLTPLARSEAISSNADIIFTADSAEWGSVSANAGVFYNYSGYANPDDNIDDCNSVFGTVSRANWSGSIELSGIIMAISASGGWTWNLLESTALTDSTGSAVNGSADQHSADGRMLINIEWGQLDFIPAAGFDWSRSNYGGLEPVYDAAFSWSAAVGWSPFRSDIEEGPLYFKTNIGTSYKSPSFQDLFWPSGALASGNPDLKAEHGLSLDGGIYLTFPEPDLKFEAVGFIGTAEDLIQWLPSAGGIWRPQNIGNVINGGAELSGVFSIGNLFDLFDLKINASYNWLKAVDADSSSVNYFRQLAYRPEHSGSGGFLFSVPGILSLDFDATYLGLRYTNNSNTKYLDPVWVFSAALKYEVTENFSLALTAGNFTNQQYIDRLGYPIPGFEWALSGRVSI